MAPTCKVCQNAYSPGPRDPLSLPCGHTFCRNCLEQIYIPEDNIKCPTCKKVHSLLVDSLPRNYDLLEHAREEVQAPLVEAFPQRHQNRLRVVVKDFQGKEYPVEMSPDAQVSEIKEILVNQYGVPVDNISLSLQGNRLQEHKTLANSNIVDGSIIDVTTRFEGGREQGF